MPAALTVLLQDGVSGLQVFHDGYWHDITPVPGAFTINIGDMTQVWSNDAYRAPVHRVLAMNWSERISIPYFYNPSYDTVVAPLSGRAALCAHSVGRIPPQTRRRRLRRLWRRGADLGLSPRPKLGLADLGAPLLQAARRSTSSKPLAMPASRCSGPTAMPSAWTNSGVMPMKPKTPFK